MTPAALGDRPDLIPFEQRAIDAALLVKPVLAARSEYDSSALIVVEITVPSATHGGWR